MIYEGCQIPYQVTGAACDWGIYFNPPLIDWSILQNALWNPQSECTDLMNKMFGLYLQGKTGELNDLLLDIKKQASLFAQNRTIEFNSGINENFYRCDGNNPPTTYSAVTQETNCSMFCANVVTGTGIFISELLCGAGCCTRETPFCVNGPGDIIYGSPIYRDESPCVNDDTSIFSIYSDTCPSDSTPLETCNSACSKI